MSSWIKDYTFRAYDGYSFSLDDGDGKGGVGPSTTQISSQKGYFWLDGGDFVSYHSRLSLL